MYDNVDPAVLPLGIFFFFCSLVGVVGNSIMIICSIVTKRLRSPCHFLISATCLIDALHISGQFPFCFQLFTGLTASQSQCFFILSIPVIGLTAGGPLILAMGIDRFVAVKFPTSYRYYQQAPVRYIVIQLIFPILYTIAFLIYGYTERDTDESNQITCANPLALNGRAFQVYNYTSGLLYVVIFFLYFKVYFSLKSNKTSSRFKKVFRSIGVTVCFVLFGWMTTTIANASSYAVTDDLNVAHLIQMYAGIAVNFAAASNVFVFYSINSEYRESINAMLGIGKKSGVSHTETSTTQEAAAPHSSGRSKSISVLSLPKFLSSSKISQRRMTLV
ncbi:unnamed protein product [Caenorhabditis sp. 36 PRJEB53466]|nr:unnamed protein product [Caenorhabditis sp. 36 PRJEB53466]